MTESEYNLFSRSFFFLLHKQFISNTYTDNRKIKVQITIIRRKEMINLVETKKEKQSRIVIDTS
jgi:hypothetical protein